MATWPNDWEELDKFHAAFKDGNAEAFKRMFDLYYTRLVVYVQRKIGNKCIAEDIVLEVFYKLYNHRTNITPRLEHLTNYLYTMAQHAAVDYVRELHKKRISEWDFLALLDEFYIDPCEFERERIDVTQEITAAVEQLPRAQRKIVKLLFFKGYRVRRIAVILGLSEQTVRNHKNRALARLREIARILG